MENTAISAITTAMSGLLEMSGTIVTTIVSNPVLCLSFAGGFVFLAIGIVKKIRG